jgi:NTP pyrophosphatase (non-canonical NTP hydrolase)
LKIELPNLDIKNNTEEVKKIDVIIEFLNSSKRYGSDRSKVTQKIFMEQNKTKAMIHNQRDKILEESEELYKTDNMNDICSEAIDVLQATLQLINLLVCDNEELFKYQFAKHVEKLYNRKWNLNGTFTVEV